MEKYYVAHSGAGTYGTGDAYKIYLIEVEDGNAYIKKSIAGVYFEMHRGQELNSSDFNYIFDTYEEARYYTIKDLLGNIFKGRPIFDLEKLGKRLGKNNMR